MSIKIPEKITIAAIENCLNILRTSSAEIDLVIPELVFDYDIGSQGILCQFINLWIRTTSTASIIIDKTSPVDEHKFIRKLIKNNFMLPLVLMTIKQKRRFCDKAGVDLTLSIRKAVLAELNESKPRLINGVKQFKKEQNSIAEFCFDHAEYSDNKFNSWFYQEGVEEPMQDSGFKSFYNAAIKHLAKGNYDIISTATNAEFSEELSGILRELFDNTHRHAIDGFFGVPLIPNVRGVMMEIHNGSLKNLANKVEIGDPLFLYFTNPFFQDYEKELSFLEISLLDSGIGYSQKFSGLPLDQTVNYVERQNVIRCFTKYNRSTRNRGLKRVISHLTNLNGFFFLRSGRLHIYRNLLVKPYMTGDYLAPDFELEASMKNFALWEGDNIAISNLQETSGSLITMLIPIIK